MNIKMYVVESSNVQAIGYDKGSIYVMFKNDSIYKYQDVPTEIFNGLLEAESVGKYLNKEIKKTYECSRIWDDDPIYTEIVKSTTETILGDIAK